MDQQATQAQAARESDRPRQRRVSRRLALLKRMGLFNSDRMTGKVVRALTWEDLAAAYRLVHDVFVREGYILPRACGLRLRVFEALPETATFIVKADGQVAGVQSLVPDSPDLHLPSDHAFGREIDALRRPGRRICEATNEAIADEFRKSSIPTELMRCLYAHATAIGCNDLITTICPGHAKFYSLLGFSQVSAERSYSAEVEDPVVLMHMDFDTIASRAAQVDQNPVKDDAFFKSYYLDENPYHRYVRGWAVVAERLFADPLLLRELFLVRSDLLDLCGAAELQAIRTRWDKDGQDVFARVFVNGPGVAASM